MKEIKDFLKEVDENPNFTAPKEVKQITDEVKRLVSEAYIAGMNFQAGQVKHGNHN